MDIKPSLLQMKNVNFMLMVMKVWIVFMQVIDMFLNNLLYCFSTSGNLYVGVFLNIYYKYRLPVYQLLTSLPFINVFSFAWLELVSHRTFMPKLLAGNSQKGWPLLHRLLVDLFQFMEPFLRNAEMGELV